MAVTWDKNQEIKRKMRILKEESIGLIIDVQERLFPHISENKELEKNINILIQGMKILKMPVMVTEQYSKGLGPTIPTIKTSLGDIRYYEKNSFSCCDNKYFDYEFSGLNKKIVVIAGIEAHVCVLQTSIDLIERGYQPVIVEDCISSRKMLDKQVAIERMRHEGALVTTYESVLFELARVSGTEQFKAISKLVK